VRLELAEFPVNEIILGSENRYRSATLELNQDELLGGLHQDKRIENAKLAVVLPGECARITHIRDIVEPRIKVRGQGQVFPGILGSVTPVGEGRTHRLSGMAVVAAAEYEGTIRAGTAVQRSAILDMWGPGAEISHFSSLIQLVLILRLAKGLAEIDAHTAIQQAEYQLAFQLAKLTTGLKPSAVEVFELGEADPLLPSIVLIQGCLTHSGHPHSNLAYYGLPIRDSLATLVHPNELLDGAMTVDTTRGIGYYPTTWDWQNHPLVMGLYRSHRKQLNFVGMIVERIRFETHHGKEVIAQNTMRMAKALHAEGALVSWLGSGNAFVDVMLTVQACERAGIKTVLVTYEYGGKDGVDSPLLYYVPEANAVISTGSRDRWLELPSPDRAVGPNESIQILTYPGSPLIPAQSLLTLDAREMIIGGVDIWGRGYRTCVAY